MKGLGLLFKFMTRLPVVGSDKYDEVQLGKSLKYFPLVGVVIGCILFIVGGYLKIGIENQYAIAVLLVLLEVIITGGLHLDGLADTFDGIFSYRSKHRMLEIMKDSRIGSNGVLALIMYFMLKVFLLVEVGMGAVLIFPIIGRLNSVINAGIGPYARATGMGKALVKYTDNTGMLVATILTVGAMAFALPIMGGDTIAWSVGLLVSVVCGIYFAKLMERKIGGVTGDTLGAVVELTEVLVLLVVALF